MTTTYHGSCLCGQFRFSHRAAHQVVRALPLHHAPARPRRRVVTWIGVPEDSSTSSLAATPCSGPPRPPTRDEVAAAIAGARSSFAPQRWPGEIHVVRANALGDIDRAPGRSCAHRHPGRSARRRYRSLTSTVAGRDPVMIASHRSAVAPLFRSRPGGDARSIVLVSRSLARLFALSSSLWLRRLESLLHAEPLAEHVI